ncbi:MAG: hypothetical protein EOP53_14130 [Sphingobacteriales bacterium]|nr:MAG: hypothetical protein EOP53_14130 [Sphingobacteriales bacterium]
MIPAKKQFEIHKKRDFGEVISDTFLFVRIHFNPLLRAILTIAGPFILLASIYTAFTQVNMLDISRLPGNFNLFGLNLIISNMFLFLAILLLYTTVHSYVKNVMEITDNAKPTVEEVWRGAKTGIWKSIGIGLGFGLIMMIIAGAYAFIFRLGGAVLMVFVFLIGFFAVIYFIFRFVYTFPAALVDEYSVAESFSRSWKLTYDHFWANFGIALVFSLLISMVGLVAMIPYFILTFMTAMHGSAGISPIWKFVVIVTQTAGTFIANSSYAVFAIAFIIQYFSAVEKTEGVGLLQKIENLELTKEDERWGEETY